MTYPTFTSRAPWHTAACDRCGATVPNRWQAMTAHVDTHLEEDDQ